MSEIPPSALSQQTDWTDLANFSIPDPYLLTQEVPRAAPTALINRSGVPLLSLGALIYPLNLFTKQSTGSAPLMFRVTLSTPTRLLKNRAELSSCVINNLCGRLYWGHWAQPEMNLIVIADGELSWAAFIMTNVKTIVSGWSNGSLTLCSLLWQISLIPPPTGSQLNQITV